MQLLLAMAQTRVQLPGPARRRLEYKFQEIEQATRDVQTMLATMAEAVGMTGKVDYDRETGTIHVIQENEP